MTQRNFSRFGAVIVVALAIFAGASTGRDIRPSEHGLPYASSPAQNGDAQEMRSFFNSTTSSVPLPEARSVGDETWSDGYGDDGSRDRRRDRVRIGLLVAAVVCGTAGVVLMLVSGIVFVVRRRKQRAASDSELYAVNDK